MRNLHLGLYTPNQGVPKHSGSLFHSTRAVPEKNKILEEEFVVAMNEELEREVLVMCNLSQGVKAEGISIGEMRMLVKQVRSTPICTGYARNLASSGGFSPPPSAYPPRKCAGTSFCW